MTAPGAFIIFGATGDLARRMLFPSLYFLDMDGLLPAGLQIIGAARSRTKRRDMNEGVDMTGPPVLKNAGQLRRTAAKDETLPGGHQGGRH